MTTTQAILRRGRTLEEILQGIWKTDPTITIAQVEGILDQLAAHGVITREWDDEGNVIDLLPPWPTVQ
jgi:hypothetical protein